MPASIGTNARQAATITRARTLAYQAIEALNELRAMNQARNQSLIGINPSNNPADTQSFLDAAAVELGFGDAQIAATAFDNALAAAENVTTTGDFQSLVALSGYYEQEQL
jgi:hypothetical protein